MICIHEVITYVRLIIAAKKCYINEFSTKPKASDGEGAFHISNCKLPIKNNTINTKLQFDYVFRKIT